MGIKSNRWDPTTWRLQDVVNLDQIGPRMWTTLKETWYMGFTSFGGPPVHFKIFRDKYVTKLHWIDETVYQELFSICQAFSGPGSTKMHYCINLIRLGFLPAVFSFFLWSLPGALGMFALALGISNVGETLPRAVYALLSGLNAATVGIIALAAVQLAQKAITDKMTRLLVYLSAAAGLLYNALWYFPVLMLAAGVAAVVWDFRWLHPPVLWFVGLFKKKKTERETDVEREVELREQVPAGSGAERGEVGEELRRSQEGKGKQPEGARERHSGGDGDGTSQQQLRREEEEVEERVVPQTHKINLMSWKSGLALIIAFLASFVAVMLTRGLIPTNPLLYRLFSNLYLAGTIIFGGGPVVIPLLREYIVAENWVSTRDFLIGLALIQGFPGPNFNFAVYLGTLTAINGGHSGALGGFLGFLAIFLPGIWTVHGTMGLWSAIRGWRWVKSSLRGINAAAVGLIYTAVYRLWQIGWIDEGFSSGKSLADDPWWVVVTAGSYVGGAWFGVEPPVACIFGAVLGLVRYGVVEAQGY
ncbi:chromate transporter-domain-containing protein [Triangularia verruculosa]|uniref:Chromate transporter-domain-containing protein n=1 Tax=Triangularia verruculosa TaxID=2587418 RepID=A0AAN7AUD7_9PEZI|nr:chromate transporter-domain-containing protein [Triangularia verruculosa]